MQKISASILGEDNKVNLINKLIKYGIKQIHYDVMDGIFVPRHAMSFDEINDIIKKTKSHIIDIHLMVNSPNKSIEIAKKFANYLTFHYESESIDKIKKLFRNNYGSNIGIAINPNTNVEQIYQFLPDVTHILIMAVYPGKGGQDFIQNTLNKIKKLKKYIVERKLNVLLQIDGGINNIIGPKVFKAGADSIVSGSYLINNIGENIVEKIINN